MLCWGESSSSASWISRDGSSSLSLLVTRESALLAMETKFHLGEDSWQGFTPIIFYPGGITLPKLGNITLTGWSIRYLLVYWSSSSVQCEQQAAECKQSVFGQSRNTLFTSAACCTHCTLELDLSTKEIPYGVKLPWLGRQGYPAWVTLPSLGNFIQLGQLYPGWATLPILTNIT